MKKVLKNPTIRAIDTNSYGKNFHINPKGSLTITDNQADKIAQDLISRYSFLQDITPKTEIKVETVEVTEKNHKGRNVKKTKKVVKQGRGVKPV